nr:hypothetical protein [Sodalis glossinidius]
MKIAVNAPYGVRKHPDSLDIVINAYRVKLDDLKSDIAGEKLELLAGKLD